jgi:hypothetical protein
MAKGDQVITHRCDFLHTLKALGEAKFWVKQQLFFMFTYWGIFLFTIGLLFQQKHFANLTDDLFWAYFFIIAGLIVLLKAGVLMLVRRK